MGALYPDDTSDEDRWNALLGVQPLSAPMLQDPAASAMASAPIASQLPPAQAAPQRTPEMDAYEALAGVGGPPPTPNHDWDRAGLILAMFADAIANGGRGVGALSSQFQHLPDDRVEEYNAKMGDAYKRAQIASMLRQGQGHQEDPRVLALRERGLNNEDRRLSMEEQRLKNSASASESLNSLDSEETARLRQVAIGMGADANQVANMTGADIMKWRPQIGQAAQVGRSGSEWDRRNEVRVQNQIDTEGRKPALAAEVAKASTTGRLDATNGTPDEAIASFLAANPKLDVTDPGTFRTLGSNPRTAAQRQQQLMTATRALDASERLRALDAEYASIPITERLSDRARAIAAEYDALVTEHQGILQKIAASGAGSAEERELIRSGIPSIYNPLANARLQGIENMLHLNVGANLAPYGIGVKGDHGAAPGKGARQDKSGPPPGDTLPVTDGPGPKVGEVVNPDDRDWEDL